MCVCGHACPRAGGHGQRVESILQRWPRRCWTRGGGGSASSAQHHQRDGPASSLGTREPWAKHRVQCAVVASSGRLARHSTINEMGTPYRLGMGTEQCAVVVISKSWTLRSMFLPLSLSIIACEQSKHREHRRVNSVRRPIRADAADGRRHCRCHLRSLRYCWLCDQPAHWHPTHN